jgi:hypothetical protein
MISFENEDELRERIKEISPEIRHDVNLMADEIRELVRLERDKAGIPNNTAGIWLLPNERKSSDKDPDFVGRGLFNGQRLDVCGWLRSDSIAITLRQIPA